MAISSRRTEYQVVHSIRVDAAYNTPGLSSGLLFGSLPKDSVLLNVVSRVHTTFNAATTNVLTVGTSTTATEILDAATSGSSITETAGVPQILVPIAGFDTRITAETPLYIKFAQTGTAATAGAATVVVNYLANAPEFIPSA